MPKWLKCFMKNRVTLDRVITAPDCAGPLERDGLLGLIHSLRRPISSAYRLFVQKPICAMKKIIEALYY